MAGNDRFVARKARFIELLKEDRPYPTEVVEGTQIPIFRPRSPQDKEQDKYDKKDRHVVDRYTGIFAFGHQLLQFGGAEGLYRTIDSILLSSLERTAAHIVLDVGCGVGRTLYDCADLFPEGFFIGMDYAYHMCRRAQAILLDGEQIPLAELARSGFGKDLALTATKRLENVFIAQGSVDDLPFKPDSFDCVINTYLIDRLTHEDDPEKAIEQMVAVLKPGGLFILSDALNFGEHEKWERIPNKHKIGDWLVGLIEDRGIEIKEWFDGLVYREVLDARGNYQDWLSFVCYGRKRRAG